MTTQHAFDLARRIDISCVRAQHGQADVLALAAQAMQWHCINAHVLPNWLPLLRQLLNGSDTLAAAPVGFPSGGAETALKVEEAGQLVALGVQELDVVINIGRLIDGDSVYVLDELVRVLEEVPESIPVKAIIESSLLNEQQIRTAARLVAESGAAFVKTGTGWAGPATPATVAVIAAELDSCGAAQVQIKAAGGIRTPADIERLTDAGASRFGIGFASAVAILTEVSES